MSNGKDLYPIDEVIKIKLLMAMDGTATFSLRVRGDQNWIWMDHLTLNEGGEVIMYDGQDEDCSLVTTEPRQSGQLLRKLAKPILKAVR